MSKLLDDPRIDPRIKAVMGMMPMASQPDATSRDELLAEANSAESIARMEQMKGFFAMLDNEQIAPSTGLAIATHEFTSSPDGNTIKVQFIRPESAGPLPCVYYIHGGGMQVMSCFDGMYRSWGRIIAAQGVAVAMVDFRNCLTPSSAPEIAPFPAGLNDCVSGVKWLHAERANSVSIPATSSSRARAAAEPHAGRV
jgi:acetyl esterase/lipase